jgi:hypothetical protein
MQRRLGIDDNLAAVREAELKQTTRTGAIHVYQVIIQPTINLRLNTGQDRSGFFLILGIR